MVNNVVNPHPSRLPPLPSGKGGVPPKTNGFSRSIPLIAAAALGELAYAFIRYYRVGAKLLKSSLKVVALLYSEIAEKVDKVIASVALLSVSLKFFFHIKSFYKHSKSLEENYRLADSEGFIWALVNLLIKPVAIVDGILSFGKSLKALYGLTWIQLFSVVAAPAAITLLCHSTFKKLFRSLSIIYELAQLPSSISTDPTKFGDDQHDQIKEYLKRKVGITNEEREEIKKATIKQYSVILQNESSLNVPAEKETGSNFPEDQLFFPSPERPKLDELENLANDSFRREIKLLKDKKINRVTRNVDKKIVKYMIRANHFLNENKKNSNNKNLSLSVFHDVKKLMIRRSMLDIGSGLFASIEATIYVASFFLSVINFQFSLIFTLSKTTFALFKHIFINTQMNSQLKNPTFYPKIK